MSRVVCHVKEIRDSWCDCRWFVANVKKKNIYIQGKIPEKYTREFCGLVHLWGIYWRKGELCAPWNCIHRFCMAVAFGLKITLLADRISFFFCFFASTRQVNYHYTLGCKEKKNYKVTWFYITHSKWDISYFDIERLALPRFVAVFFSKR